jgi:GNAT superfamily N-acetyltransferase
MSPTTITVRGYGMAEAAANTEPTVTVLPLTAPRFGDLAALFRSGIETRWCWCMYFRRSARGFKAATAAENRADLETLAGSEPAAGYVAYRDGAPVGWVSAGPIEGYPRIGGSRFYPRTDPRPVWSIVCFFVAPGARRDGVARALLAAAVDAARAAGAPAIEAYPIEASGPRHPSSLYRGPLPLYREAGFAEVARVPVPPGAVRVIVRRELT